MADCRMHGEAKSNWLLEAELAKIVGAPQSGGELTFDRKP